MENFIERNQQRKEKRVNNTNMCIWEIVLLGGRECCVIVMSVVLLLCKTKEDPILKEKEEE